MDIWGFIQQVFFVIALAVIFKDGPVNSPDKKADLETMRKKLQNHTKTKQR